MEINVRQHSKLNIVCPNPANVLDKQAASIPQEKMYENMWIVDKHGYDTCTVNTSVSSFLANKTLLTCDSPLQLKYYPMVFRSYSVLGGIEFVPGTKYYFIGKSRSNILIGEVCFLRKKALQVHCCSITHVFDDIVFGRRIPEGFYLA